jgi:hypothetical protein
MIPYVTHTLSFSKGLFNLAMLGVVAAATMTSSFQERGVTFRYRSRAEATKDLTGVQTGVPGQYDTAWQKLKSKSEVQMRDNDKKIEQFKAQRAKGGKAFRATYDRRVTELEMRNISLKAKLNDYKGERRETWTESR